MMDGPMTTETETHSRCGWCATGHHSKCPVTLQSLPGWRCGCGCRREDDE